jgi:FKBP-type peptidyl-prolyl cis-trans isomerase
LENDLPSAAKTPLGAVLTEAHAGMLLACIRPWKCRFSSHLACGDFNVSVWFEQTLEPNLLSGNNMFKRFCIQGALTMLVLSVVPSVIAQDNEVTAAKAGHEPVGYILGYSVGSQMSQSGFNAGDFDIEGLLAGFNDGMQGKDSALSDEVLRETQVKIQTMLQTRQREKGTRFLAANAKKEGVKVLEAGVQYKVLATGKGKSPAPTDTVSVHYTGTLIDGSVFDSSVQRGQPATFPVNGVIQGWQMALQKMKVGDKWMLYIPSDLAYGEQGSQGAIGPHEVLVFEVELLAIK